MIVFHNFPPTCIDDISLTKIASDEYLHELANEDELHALGVFVGSTLYENLGQSLSDADARDKAIILAGELLMKHATLDDFDLWPAYHEGVLVGLPEVN